jgi:hypothetical protein
MPDTNSGCMLTAPQARPASMAAVNPADRMHPAATLPPGRPVAARKRTPWPANGWLGRGVLMAGLAMIPWVFILACSLPPATRAAHWPAAWAGLDALEAAGLMATGVALIGRYSWLCLPAAVTSTLLVIDTWFDITTSAPGPAATVAIAMAIFPELPMAGLCAVLAIRHAPRCTLCHRHERLRERLPTEKRTGPIWRVSSGTGGRPSPAKGRATRRPPACGATTSSSRRGRESTARPPRRYHHLTKDGELALASFNKQGRAFHDAGDEILSEGSQQ